MKRLVTMMICLGAILLAGCQKEPSLTLSSSGSVELSADGGSQSITFTSNRDWTASSSDSWVSVSPSSGTASDGPVTVTVRCNQNTTYEDRTATVTIKAEGLSQSVTVRQPANLGIVLPTQAYNLASDARSIEVEVQANVEYTVSVSDSWIKQTGTKGLTSKKLSFSVEENTGYDARSATITVKPQNTGVQEQVISVKQAQKDALIVKDTSYDMPYGGGEIEVKVESNVDFEVKSGADWIQYVETKALKSSTVRLRVTENTTGSAREGKVEIKQKGGTLSHTVTVKQAEPEWKVKERAALIAFYKATDGDNWINKDNWCSDKPVGEWYGVGTDSRGSVVSLNLYKNNLTGKIPPEIGDLSNLEWLQIFTNNISGLPEEIGNLSNLYYLDLRFSGTLGKLPAGLGSLNKLDYFSMYESGVTGKIPSSILNNPNIWSRFWNGILQNNKVETEGLNLPMNTSYDDYTFENLEGNGSIRLFDEYTSNKYTVMYNWAKWCPYSTAFSPELISIYNRYHAKGLQVIGYCDPQSVTDSSQKTEKQIRGELSEYAASVGMPWNNYFINYEKGSPAYSTNLSKLWPGVYPAVMVVDQTGNAVFADAFGIGKRENLESFIKGLLGDGEPMYESTDYSADGRVKTIQSHTVGNGIKLVFTGDAFCDKDIADGTFDARVQQAVEAFFREEPYKSLRDRFDVYSVTAVSKNGEVSAGSETAFSTVFGSGSEVDGDRNKVFEYANKVPGIDISKATINVIVNSSHYGGICYMYSDNSSISFTPVISFDDELFAQCVSHETAGHGFAKLKDEYDYGQPITEKAKAEFLEQKAWGWGANVDIVGTASDIQWSFMLNDSRYKNHVGIYEGALSFGSGAWRPTLNSIMRFNTDGFNAPSRFAIYKRIVELSEGRTVSFEEFATFDAKNLEKASARRMSAPKKTDDGFVPFADPVVIKGSWRGL